MFIHITLISNHHSNAARAKIGRLSYWSLQAYFPIPLTTPLVDSIDSGGTCGSSGIVLLFWIPGKLRGYLSGCGSEQKGEGVGEEVQGSNLNFGVDLTSFF